LLNFGWALFGNILLLAFLEMSSANHNYRGFKMNRKKGYARIFIVLCGLLTFPTSYFIYSIRDSWGLFLADENQEYLKYKIEDDNRKKMIQQQFFESINEDEKVFLEKEFGSKNIIDELQLYKRPFIPFGPESIRPSEELKIKTNKIKAIENLKNRYNLIERMHPKKKPPNEYLFPPDSVLFVLSILLGIVPSILITAALSIIFVIFYVILMIVNRIIIWIQSGFIDHEEKS
jgi:hypothetical protein